MNSGSNTLSRLPGYRDGGQITGLLVVLILVNGCALGPDYETPDTHVLQEQQWIDIDAPQVNSDSADLARWS